MKELLELFIVFFKIGGFTFGGGYAMIPIMQEEMVKKRNWVTDEEILDYFAIGQCTPGIIGVNTASFIGYKRRGISGAVIATLGLVTPSVIIISIIAKFLDAFQEIAVVQHAFAGIQVVVVALILNVVIDMYGETVKDNLGMILSILSFIGIAVIKLSPIIVVLGAGFIGVIIYMDIIKIGREK